MDTFIVLRDVNHVMVALNRRHVVSVVLVHAGESADLRPMQPAFVPLVSVRLADGLILENLLLPTVDNGRGPDTARRAVFNFFEWLQGNEVVGITAGSF